MRSDSYSGEGSNRAIPRDLSNLAAMPADCATKPLTAREQTAREVLEDLIKRIDEKRYNLTALYNALPLELPYAADKALCDLLRLVAK